MEKRVLGVLGIVAIAVGATGALGAVELGHGVSVQASLRTRGEVWSWFESRSGADDEYAFGATLLRAAVSWKRDPFEILLEGQNTALFALPDGAVGPAPEGPLGAGGVYFAHNRARDDASVFLKQGYVSWRPQSIPGLSLRAGRFEFAEGSEVFAGEPTLDWVRKARVSERLIGPFGWSHVGRALDGGRADASRGPFQWTAVVAHPTQGGFDLAGMKEIDEIDLVYAAMNVLRPAASRGTDARVFYIYYGDGRGLLKSDNRPLEIRQADRQDISIHSVGAHWIQLVPLPGGPVDLLGWAVVQRGQWGRLEQRGFAFDFEAGWQPEGLPGKPWLRVGYGRSSGDDDPSDGDHGTFFQILPTARLYSFSTFYNLMNDEDGFVQLLLRPAAGWVWRSDVHAIRLVEGRDLWYQGAGATVADRAVGFGFPGRPAFGERDLLRVVETSLTWSWRPSVSLGVYYAHAFGSTVVRRLFAGDDADYGFVEVTLGL
jgi:hypothetical protein